MIGVAQQIGEEFKENLQKIYGNSLLQVILFGSYSRGDYNAESDIDFAVVLDKSDIVVADEIFKITPISTDISLKYSKLISFLPVSYQKFRDSKLSIYKFIRNEGIKI